MHMLFPEAVLYLVREDAISSPLALHRGRIPQGTTPVRVSFAPSSLRSRLQLVLLLQ